MATIEDILLQYAELTSFCTSFFNRISTTYGKDMKCRKGCSDCCCLSSVCALEAFRISRYIFSGDLNICERDRNAREISAGKCPFLISDICSIYPARPIICRTHGLPMINPDSLNPDYCPLNFSDTPANSLAKDDFLDISRITTNLMKLNIAFCLILNNRELSGRRYSLTDVKDRKLPRELSYFHNNQL